MLSITKKLQIYTINLSDVVTMNEAFSNRFTASHDLAQLPIAEAICAKGTGLQCFDAVGWAAGRASACKKVCGMVEVGTG